MQRKAIYFGWWVLLGCAAIELYFYATFVSGFTTLFNPIVEEFGWSYFIVSLAMSFRGLETGFLSPVIGYMVDRFKPRNILIVGILLGTFGFFLLGRIHTMWAFYVAFVVLGTSLSMTSPVVVNTAVAPWFKNRLGFAFGVVAAGMGLGGIFVPVLVMVIDKYGWRNAVDYFGIGALIICLPLCFLIREPKKIITTDNKDKQNSDKIKLGTLLRDKFFWVLSAIVFLTGLAFGAVGAHQVPYIVSVGLTRNEAGLLAIVLAMAGVIGRFGLSWLADLIGAQKCFIIATLILVFGLVIFAFSTSTTAFCISLFFVGLGGGGVLPLRATLQVKYFGMKSFAVIQGLVLLFVTFGMMAAPPFAGWVYDTYGTYTPAWLVFAAIGMLTIPVLLFAPKAPVSNQHSVI